MWRCDKGSSSAVKVRNFDEHTVSGPALTGGFAAGIVPSASNADAATSGQRSLPAAAGHM